MAKYLSNRVRTFDIGITSITESDVVLNVIGNTTFDGNVSLGDGNKIQLGDGPDLDIYHQNGQSYIRDIGSGNLRLETQGAAIILASTEGEDMGKFFRNAQVELYYDNSKKFETTSTGATTTGIHVADGFDLGDDERIRLGDSQDLQIYHDSTFNNGVIQESGSGNLLLAGQNIDFRDANLGDTYALFRDDSINTSVELYYNNTKKFETSTTGVTVTGTLTADGVDLGDNDRLRFGDSQDLQIYHDGSNSYINESGVGDLYIRGSSIVHLQTAGGEDGVKVITDGAVELYYDNTKRLETTATGATTTGTLLATSLSTGASGTGVNISANTISGPATLTIDPAVVGANSGTVVIAGDLQIDGTTTTVNSTTMSVDDKNLELGTGAANDAAANGGGITIVSGDGNKTFQFEATGDNLGSSENLNLADTKEYKINNTSVLSATTLGSGVTDSSLTSVGTLTSLSVNGDLSISDKIVHIGDTNTAIRFPAADTFTVETAGTERLRINSDGEVGIGTDLTAQATNAKLTVEGSAALTNLDQTLMVRDSNTDDAVGNGGFIGLAGFVNNTPRTLAGIRGLKSSTGSSFNGDLAFYTRQNAVSDLDEKLRITSAGVLLSGVSSTSNTAASAIIQGSPSTNASNLALTSNTSTPADGDQLGNIAFADSNHSQSAYVGARRDGGTWTSGSSQPTSLVFVTTPDGTTNFVRRMTIKGNGSVGIGVDDPETLLHLQSNGPVIRFTDADQATDNKSWNIGAGQTQLLRIQAINDSGTGGGQLFDFYRNGNQIEKFLGRNGGSYWFAIDNNNKRVGIGTENPSTLLEVAGTGSPALRISDLDGTNQFGQIFANNGTFVIESRNDTSDGEIIFRGRDSAGTTEKLRIGSAGQIGLSGTNYGTSGQVLTSNGTTSAPTWQDVSSINLANEATDTETFLTFALDATGQQALKTNANLTFNSNTGALSASTLVSNVATGTAPLTVTSTTLVSNLNADLLDGQEGSFYLNTGTNFGGDVSGTYNAIQVANDSHTHQFNNLTSKTSGTGNYSTTGYLESGRGSGGVALTINDGYGNANVTFNHRSGTPEQNGKAGRIEVNTDATTGDAIMSFELGAATSGVAAGINQILQLSSGTSAFSSNAGLTFNNRPAFNGGATGTTSPFTVDSTQVVTNLNADLLDGQQGTFYTDASNIDAGTLAIARGGTNGSATPTAGGAAYGTGTAYAFTAAGTSGQVLTSNGASPPTWQNATASVSAVDESTDTTCFPLFATDATGTINVKTDASGLTYDSANERLQATDVTVKGAVRCENSASTERFEIIYNETTDSLDFSYFAS